MRKGILLFVLFFTFILLINSTNSSAYFAEDMIVVSEEELVNAINNGASSIVIGDDIYLEQPLEIRHHVRISGVGSIRVTGHFRHFMIHEEGTLILEGELTLKMAGTMLQRGGGIVVSGGRFYMHGGEIVNIYPPYRDEWRPIRGTEVIKVRNGGNFHMYGGVISQGRLTSVRVEEGSFEMHDGEISHSHGSGVSIIEDSIFYMYGGRIVHNSGRGVVVDLDDKGSSFHMHGGEISHNGGMGVLVNMSGGEFNFHDGVISNNGNSGVEIRGGIFNMYGGVIKDNSATRVGNQIYSVGGGVELHTGSVFTMNGGEIIGNTADKGGGVYAYRSRIYMIDGRIVGNTADNGGGVAIRGGLRQSLANISRFYIHLYGGEISENEAEFKGGGILVELGVLKMDGGTIRGNRASRGGGIATEHAYGVIHGGVIQENVAEFQGGGIYFDALMYSFALTGGRIIENSAISGGGIYTERPHQLATGSEVVFGGNAAQSSFHIRMRTGKERYPNLMWAGENSIYDSHLLNNYDINYQGRWEPTFLEMYLILTGIAAIVMILRWVFHRRKKEISVGATCMVLFLVLWMLPSGLPVMAAEEVEVVTNEQELIQAVAQSERTIIVNHVIHIEETIEINRPVTIGGTGAIVVADNIRHFYVSQSGELTLKDDITITLAEGYQGTGGGINVLRGTLHMYGGEITGNNATGFWYNSGGGVRVSGGVFHFHGGRIHGNTAAFGGGIGLSGGRIGHAILVIYGGEIYNNHALVNGGGIGDKIDFLTGRDLVRMYGGSIRGNVADIAGGGIHSENSVLQLFEGEIYSNTASGHGGINDTSFGSQVTISETMRIVNNYPPSFHDTHEGPTFMWFVTPDGFRYAGVLILAIIATWWSRKSYKKKVAVAADSLQG